MSVARILKKSVLVNVIRETADVGNFASRRLASTAPQIEVFHVQDTKDFDERVKNSKVPVIVDFFAT